MSRVLFLTIKKQWFDMVGNGKPEEYREFNDFWIKRLCDYHPGKVGGYCFDLHKNGCYTFKEWDQVLFANGGHFGNVPKKLFKWEGMELRTGNPEWGAEPGKKYFVIKLGEKIETI
jgi:hypothetical protein